MGTQIGENGGEGVISTVIKWDEAQTVKTESNYWKRRMLEALRIQSIGNTSNFRLHVVLIL